MLLNISIAGDLGSFSSLQLYHSVIMIIFLCHNAQRAGKNLLKAKSLRCLPGTKLTDVVFITKHFSAISVIILNTALSLNLKSCNITDKTVLIGN